MITQKVISWLDNLDIDNIEEVSVIEQIEALLEKKQADIKKIKFQRRESIAKEWEAKSEYFKQAITNVMMRTLDENLQLLENNYLGYKGVKQWIDSHVKALDSLAAIVPLGRLQDGIHEDSVKRSKLKLRKELNGFFYISYHYCFNEGLILKIVKQSAFQHAGLCTQTVLDEVNLLVEKKNK